MFQLTAAGSSRSLPAILFQWINTPLPFSFACVQVKGRAGHITKRPNFKDGWWPMSSGHCRLWGRLKQFWEPDFQQELQWDGVMRQNCLMQSCTEQSLGSVPQHYRCQHQTSYTQHHSPDEVPWNICTALLSRVCRMEPRSNPETLGCREARAFLLGSTVVPESSCCHNKSGHLSQQCWERRCFPDLPAGRTGQNGWQKLCFCPKGCFSSVLTWGKGEF